MRLLQNGLKRNGLTKTKKIMKYILVLALLALLTLSCKDEPKEINNNPLVIEEVVTLAPQQKGFIQDIDNPSRGKIKVVINNYTDSTKTFIISIKEK